jgi:outer membrane translocation and assembly module TamA
VAFFETNKDDGIFIGGGVKISRHGFRKEPFAQTHRIMANFAAKTQAFNVRYMGHYTRMLGLWDLEVDAAWLSPNNIRNFYGLGNETENTEQNRRFYQAQLGQVEVRPLLVRPLSEGASFFVGPTFEFTNVRETSNRFVGQAQAGISNNSFKPQTFLGLEAGMDLRTIDNLTNPKQGFRWINRADLNLGFLNDKSETYTRLETDFKLFISPSLSPQVTLGLRAGAAHNIGDFPFFAANTLGGSDNLRGHRRTRFAGRTSAYQNAELRIQLTRFATYFVQGTFGILGFIDNGRVWTDGEQSDLWHQGYGGGVWFNIFDTFVLQIAYGTSADDRAVNVGFGFQF